jgi:hypothetical protein
VDVNSLQTPVSGGYFIPHLGILADACRVSLKSTAVEENVTAITLGDEAEMLVFSIPLDDACAQPWPCFSVVSTSWTAGWGFWFETEFVLQALFLNAVDEGLAATLTSQDLITIRHGKLSDRSEIAGSSVSRRPGAHHPAA